MKEILTILKSGCRFLQQKFLGVHVAFLSVESFECWCGCFNNGCMASTYNNKSREGGEPPAIFPSAHTASSLTSSFKDRSKCTIIGTTRLPRWLLCAPMSPRQYSLTPKRLQIEERGCRPFARSPRNEAPRRYQWPTESVDSSWRSTISETEWWLTFAALDRPPSRPAPFAAAVRVDSPSHPSDKATDRFPPNRLWLRCGREELRSRQPRSSRPSCARRRMLFWIVGLEMNIYLFRLTIAIVWRSIKKQKRLSSRLFWIENQKRLLTAFFASTT